MQRKTRFERKIEKEKKNSERNEFWIEMKIFNVNCKTKADIEGTSNSKKSSFLVWKCLTNVYLYLYLNLCFYLASSSRRLVWLSLFAMDALSRIWIFNLPKVRFKKRQIFQMPCHKSMVLVYSSQTFPNLYRNSSSNTSFHCGVRYHFHTPFCRPYILWCEMLNLTWFRIRST